MIVCHCNTLTDAVIRQAVDQLLDEDPHRMMTPNLVYRRFGQRGRCCGCFPTTIAIIQEQIAVYMRAHPGVDIEPPPLPQACSVDRFAKLAS
jgi:bacterioferritin-associated ferredoxin